MSKITIRDLSPSEKNYLEVLTNNSVDLITICGGGSVFSALYEAIKALAAKLGVAVPVLNQ